MVLAKNALDSYPGLYLLTSSPRDNPTTATGALVLAGLALMALTDLGPPPKTNENKMYYL